MHGENRRSWGQDSIWWLSQDPEHFGHCVVCRKPGTGGFMGGPKAILYLWKEHGLRHSVSAHPVLVHKVCEAEGRAIARQQGFGWEYPPAPEWGGPEGAVGASRTGVITGDGGTRRSCLVTASPHLAMDLATKVERLIWKFIGANHEHWRVCGTAPE